MTAPVINSSAEGMPMPKEVQQQDTMRSMRFRDQHQRPWVAVVSIKTMHPCAPPTPDGWRTPLPMMTPPTKYHDFRDDDVGIMAIAYDRWIVDLLNAQRDYETHVLAVAKAEFGAAALEKIERGDPGLRALCGPPPQSPELVKAMKAGNKWALGLLRPDGSRYQQPAWAAEYVDGWVFESTFDGGDVDLEVSADQYPDVDDDAVAVADRYADAERYADDEETADPTAAHFEPIKRARGRPRKEA